MRLCGRGKVIRLFGDGVPLRPQGRAEPLPGSAAIPVLLSCAGDGGAAPCGRGPGVGRAGAAAAGKAASWAGWARAAAVTKLASSSRVGPGGRGGRQPVA